MKQIEVFDGYELKRLPVKYPVNMARWAFCGTDDNGGKVYVPFDEELLSRHIMFLGGIGTGKTNAVYQMLFQMRKSMNENDVAIVFDTKGDFYNSFYRPGDIVISNDACAAGENGEDYWNLFREIERDEHMEENIIEIARALFKKKTENTSQPFFPNAARDIFGAIITHFMRKKDSSELGNGYLRSFLDRSSAADIKQMLLEHDDLKAMASYIFDERSPQTQGVFSELQQTVREIFLGNFKKNGGLSIRELVRKKGGRFVFIEYDIGIGAVLSPIYSLIFDLAIKEALCRKKSEGSVYFVCDEFRLLPNLEHIDDAVNFGRSLGVKFLMGLQNVEQIYESYGESRAKSILSGFLTNVIFRVNDAASKEYIKTLFGDNRKKEVYMASVQGRGIVEQVRDAHVVEDWDISALRVGQAIIGLPGAEPFVFKFDRVK